MQILKDIIASGGYITSKETAELVNLFPNLKVVIKWSQLPRETISICNLKQHLIENENANNYCREVFISAQNLDKMREMGLT